MTPPRYFWEREPGSSGLAPRPPLGRGDGEVVYVVESPTGGIRKIGRGVIRRLQDWENRGWRVIQYVVVGDVGLAQTVEEHVVRVMSTPPHVSAEEMPWGGWTEAWPSGQGRVDLRWIASDPVDLSRVASLND